MARKKAVKVLSLPVQDEPEIQGVIVQPDLLEPIVQPEVQEEQNLLLFKRQYYRR